MYINFSFFNILFILLFLYRRVLIILWY